MWIFEKKWLRLVGLCYFGQYSLKFDWLVGVTICSLYVEISKHDGSVIRADMKKKKKERKKKEIKKKLRP